MDKQQWNCITVLLYNRGNSIQYPETLASTPHVGQGGGGVVQGAGARCQACLRSQSPERVVEGRELTRVRSYLPVQKHWTIFLDKHRT